MTWESWRLPYQICPHSPWGQHPAQKFPQESKPKFHLPPIFFFLFWPSQAAQSRTRMQPLPRPASSSLHLPRSHIPTRSRGKG